MFNNNNNNQNIADLDDKINSLENSILEGKLETSKEINELNDKIKFLEYKNSTLEGQLKVFNKENSNLKNNIDTLKNRNKVLEENLTNIKKDYLELKQLYNTEVSKTSNSNVHLIKHEIINFNQSVISYSEDFEELPYYTREFNITNDFSFCSVTYSIPFVCNYETRSRILLYLDNVVIDDGTMHCVKHDLKPLKLSGIYENLKSGRHYVKIKVCSGQGIGNGNLNIPLFDKYIESTKEPKISARLDIIGYN